MADMADLASWTLTACFILICINREDRHEYLDNHRWCVGYSMSGDARAGVTILVILVIYIYIFCVIFNTFFMYCWKTVCICPTNLGVKVQTCHS